MFVDGWFADRRTKTTQIVKRWVDLACVEWSSHRGRTIFVVFLFLRTFNGFLGLNRCR